jgi:hypothetical protein
LADIVATPETLGGILQEDFDDHVRGQGRMLTRGLTSIQRDFRAQAPKDSEAFADSAQPYVGEPGETWARGGGGKGPTVESVMDGWTPGQEVGIATDAPYSRKLIFQPGENRGKVTKRRGNRYRNQYGTFGETRRRTYTTKVKRGWVEKIVDAANREMEKVEP